ncbi:MAG TPA: hypothetical protein VG096_15210 [Bryobacteraceae bacterium]|nr:hypothetical protein [Bryobacteraceae bacterium]
MDELEKITGQLKSIHNELSALMKKAPNDGVNKFKLRYVNMALDRSNSFLGEDYRPFADFQTFDEEELVSNSDASFMIATYLEALEKFRSDNIKQVHGSWFYNLKGDEEVRTAAPAKIKVK